MKRLRLPASEKLVRVACYFAIVALPLIVWSIFDKTVWPLMAALTIGQGIGTLSFLLFVVVVVRDLGVKKKLRPQEQSPPDTTSPP